MVARDRFYIFSTANFEVDLREMKKARTSVVWKVVLYYEFVTLFPVNKPPDSILEPSYQTYYHGIYFEFKEIYIIRLPIFTFKYIQLRIYYKTNET